MVSVAKKFVHGKVESHELYVERDRTLKKLGGRLKGKSFKVVRSAITIARKKRVVKTEVPIQTVFPALIPKVRLRGKQTLCMETAFRSKDKKDQKAKVAKTTAKTPIETPIEPPTETRTETAQDTNIPAVEASTAKSKSLSPERAPKVPSACFATFECVVDMAPPNLDLFDPF